MTLENKFQLLIPAASLQEPEAKEVLGWDKDGDGTVDYHEIRAASQALIDARATSRRWKRSFLALALASAVLSAALFGVIFGTNELTKQARSDVDDDGSALSEESATFDSRDGDTIETVVSEGRAVGLWDLAAASDDDLRTLERLSLPAGPGAGDVLSLVVAGFTVLEDSEAETAQAANTTSVEDLFATANATGAEGGEGGVAIGSEGVDADGVDRGVGSAAPLVAQRKVVLRFMNGMELTAGRESATLDTGADETVDEDDVNDGVIPQQLRITYGKGPQDPLTHESDILITGGADTFVGTDTGTDTEGADAEGADATGGTGEAGASSRAGLRSVAQRRTHGLPGWGRHWDGVTHPVRAALSGAHVPLAELGPARHRGTPYPASLHRHLLSRATVTIHELWAGHHDREWHAAHNPHWKRRAVLTDARTGRQHLLTGGLAGAHGHAHGAVRRHAGLHPLQDDGDGGDGGGGASITFSYEAIPTTVATTYPALWTAPSALPGNPSYTVSRCYEWRKLVGLKSTFCSTVAKRVKRTLKKKCRKKRKGKYRIKSRFDRDQCARAATMSACIKYAKYSKFRKSIHKLLLAEQLVDPKAKRYTSTWRKATAVLCGGDQYGVDRGTIIYDEGGIAVRTEPFRYPFSQTCTDPQRGDTGKVICPLTVLPEDGVRPADYDPDTLAPRDPDVVAEMDAEQSKWLRKRLNPFDLDAACAEHCGGLKGADAQALCRNECTVIDARRARCRVVAQGLADLGMCECVAYGEFGYLSGTEDIIENRAEECVIRTTRHVLAPGRQRVVVKRVWQNRFLKRSVTKKVKIQVKTCKTTKERRTSRVYYWT